VSGGIDDSLEKLRGFWQVQFERALDDRFPEMDDIDDAET
jgi:hypothetical protein